MNAIKALILGSIALALNSSLYAQDPELPCDKAVEEALAETALNQVKSIGAFVPAKAIEKVKAKYPMEAAKKGKEGWVQMSYVIDEQGAVQDVVVEDFGGHKSFKSKAVAAVEKWQFEPAMKDGKPTQQCHQYVQFDFTMEGKPGASRRFAKHYREFAKFLQDGEFENAQAKLDLMHEQEANNRYEHAWLWNGEAQLASKLKDKHRERKSLMRTIASVRSHKSGKSTFDNDYIANIHQRLFLLSTTFGYYSHALKSAEKLKGMPNSEERYARIEPYILEVEKRINSDQNIVVAMNLSETGYKSHTLVRNNFAFSDIQGAINTVEVRCESHREKFTVAEEHIWSIPASWGECRVMVEGVSGTTFDLVEINQA